MLRVGADNFNKKGDNRRKSGATLKEMRMKRLMMIFLAIALCFVFHPELNASNNQDDTENTGTSGNPRIRGKVGTNLSNFKGAELNGFRCVQTTRAAAGISVATHITRNSAVLELGVHYSEKGAELTDTTSEVSSKLKINYLEIPLLIKWECASNQKVKPFVFAGAYIAFKLKATNEAVDDNVEPVEINPEEDVKKGDWGIIVGGGLQLGKIILEARYSWGLKNVIKNTEDSKNSVITLMLGYEF